MHERLKNNLDAVSVYIYYISDANKYVIDGLTVHERFNQLVQDIKQLDKKNVEQFHKLHFEQMGR